MILKYKYLVKQTFHILVYSAVSRAHARPRFMFSFHSLPVHGVDRLVEISMLYVELFQISDIRVCQCQPETSHWCCVYFDIATCFILQAAFVPTILSQMEVIMSACRILLVYIYRKKW